jgi:hypothetical protein
MAVGQEWLSREKRHGGGVAYTLQAATVVTGESKVVAAISAKVQCFSLPGRFS